MRSSTSSSEHTQRRGLTTATWALLALIVCLLIGTELATRFAIAPRSAIQRRIATESAAARNLRAGDVLFAGNSLLLWGADVPVLRKAMQPDWRAHRFIVEATTFEDWAFGLANLFEHGSRPSAVFLVLSPTQFAQHSVLGDYFARQLMAPGDLPAVASELDLHPTAITGMFLANRSAFYGLRGELRKVLLLGLVPGLDKLFALVNRANPADPPNPSASRAQTEMLERHLDRLTALSRRYGIPVILVIPPQTRATDLMDQMKSLASQRGMPVLLPIAPGALDASHYSDGFHLNEKGRRLFTPALARTALDALSQSSSSPERQ